MDNTKLELLLTARNAAKKELDTINKQLSDIEGKGKAASKGFNTKALAEPLMQLSGGPLASIIGSFKSFLTLGGMIPKIFLGPIGAVIVIVGALEKKFGIVSKSIETVMQVFDILMSLDFSGMGEKISEIWKKPTKAGQEAIDKANEFHNKMFDIQNELLTLTGKEFEARRQQVMKTWAEEEKAAKNNKDITVAEYKEMSNKILLIAQAKMRAIDSEEKKSLVDQKNIDAGKLLSTQELYAKEQEERVKNAQMRIATDKIFSDARKEVEKAEYDKKTEEIQAYNDKLERIRARRLQREEQKEQQHKEAIKQYYSEVASFITPLYENITSSLGGMFDRMINEGASAMDVLKGAFTSFGRMALQMIGKLIAKFLILSALKALFSTATGGVGGAILSFATKGLDNLLPNLQTDYNQTKIVPGPFNAPVPIMAHGGEIIGHGNRGGGGTTMVVQGDIYGWDGAVEKIRMGLINHERLTGAGLSFA